MDGSNPPSAWKVEQAMAAWQSARARLLADDADLAHDEAALTELLGPAEGDVRDILHRLIRAAAHAKSMAEAAAERAADLKAREDRFKRREQHARGTVMAIMEAMGEKKIELPDATASIKGGSQGVLITDETVLPDSCVKTERKPDKAAIGAKLKAGEAVPGAELANGMPSLQIRTK